MEMLGFLVGVLFFAVMVLGYRAWRGRVAIKQQEEDAVEYSPHEFWD